MKESERLQRDLLMTCIAGISACACVALIFIIAAMTTLWIGIAGIISILVLIWIIADILRCMKKMRYWRWLESEVENMPADLKKKYLLYEAALDVAEAYKKDVARMEERARSIKAEIEAEMKNNPR